MSNLTRWEPVREMMTLREAMDRLFDDAFTRPFSLMRDGGSAQAWSSPAIDMYQTANEVVVKAALPGIKPDEVQINVTGDILTVRGETKQEEEKKNQSWHTPALPTGGLRLRAGASVREQRWGAFDRSVRLPTEVVADKAKADFDNGVLTITLPKSEQVKPKTITVKTK